MSAGIIGAHVLLYSDNPEADLAFFRDTINFHAVDGENHQLHGGRRLLGSVLYLMCDNLPALMKSLLAKGVSCSPVETEVWGIKTTIQLPSGSEIGLYQPTHPTALGLT